MRTKSVRVIDGPPIVSESGGKAVLINFHEITDRHYSGQLLSDDRDTGIYANGYTLLVKSEIAFIERGETVVLFLMDQLIGIVSFYLPVSGFGVFKDHDVIHIQADLVCLAGTYRWNDIGDKIHPFPIKMVNLILPF